MGFRSRPSLKVGPFRLNFAKSGFSSSSIGRARPATTADDLRPRGWGWPQGVAAAIARQVVSSQCDRLLEQAERLDSKSWFGFSFGSRY